MEIIVKTAATAAIAAIVIVILKQSRPEYALLVQAAAMISVFAVCMQIILLIIGYIEEILPLSQQSSVIAPLMIKALTVAVLSKTCADICRDSGGSALAFAVETTGNAMILLICMPLFRLMAEIISGLLKG